MADPWYIKYFVLRDKPITLDQLLERTKGPEHRMWGRQMLKELEDDGLIVRVRKGYPATWSITRKGLDTYKAYLMGKLK